MSCSNSHSSQPNETSEQTTRNERKTTAQQQQRKKISSAHIRKINNCHLFTYCSFFRIDYFYFYRIWRQRDIDKSHCTCRLCTPLAKPSHDAIWWIRFVLSFSIIIRLIYKMYEKNCAKTKTKRHNYGLSFISSKNPTFFDLSALFPQE